MDIRRTLTTELDRIHEELYIIDNQANDIWRITRARMEESRDSSNNSTLKNKITSISSKISGTNSKKFNDRSESDHHLKCIVS
jgi:hypothetical protein